MVPGHCFSVCVWHQGDCHSTEFSCFPPRKKSRKHVQNIKHMHHGSNAATLTGAKTVFIKKLAQWKIPFSQNKTISRIFNWLLQLFIGSFCSLLLRKCKFWLNIKKSVFKCFSFLWCTEKRHLKAASRSKSIWVLVFNFLMKCLVFSLEEEIFYPISKSKELFCFYRKKAF